MGTQTKLRVLFGASGLSANYGGSAFSEAILAAALPEFCEVKVLCRADLIDEKFASGLGVASVTRYTRWEAANAYLSAGHPLNELFRWADVYHLNGHWQYENFFLTRLAKRAGVPYFLHPRGMLLVGHRSILKKKLFNKFLGQTIVQQAAKVIALSQFEVTQFAPYHLPVDSVAVVPNGILVPDNSPLSKPTDKPYFLYLGRLEARKNLGFLVDAFATYRRQGGTSELILAGTVERGYAEQVMRGVERHNLRGSVKFVGPAFGAEKEKLIRSAIAVIYPTREEAFGRVPFETLAESTLTIVPKNSGAAEYLLPIIPDCTYDDTSADSLAAVMKSYETLSAEERANKVRRGREWVKRELSPKTLAFRFSQLYAAALRDKSGRDHPPLSLRA